MRLVVDADSIMATAAPLLASERAAHLCLLRLVYLLRTKYNPDNITVFATGTVPFKGTSPDDPLLSLVNAPDPLDTLIILSTHPVLLGLHKYGALTFRPDQFFLNPTPVTHTRLARELGFDPLDWPVLPPNPDKSAKAKAGRDRKARYQWVEERGTVALKSIVNNVHIVVGRSGFENYEVVQDLPEFLAKLEKVDRLGWDTETDSLQWMTNNIVGESFSFDGQHGYYLPIKHSTQGQYNNIPWQEVMDKVHPVLATKRIAGANLAFDVLSLASKGVPFFRNIEDVQGYAYQLGYHVPDPSAIGLKPLTKSVLGFVMEEYAAVAAGKGHFGDVPIERAAPYAADDAVKSLLLANTLRERLTEAQQWRFDNIEMPFLHCVMRMQYNGMYVDTDYLAELRAQFEARMESLKLEMWAHAGEEFNVQAGHQVAHILFDKLGLTRTKPTKTGWSTQADDLERISTEHHIVVDLLEYKQLQKLVTTYTVYPNFISTDERIHSSIKPFFVITGRLSSTAPNLLNIPTRTDVGSMVRRAFCAQGDNYLLSADASQLEFRILAHRTGNKLLIDAFNDPARDPHREIAALIFNVPVSEVTKEQRGAAKTTVYAIIYGAWVDKIATTLGIDRQEALRIYNAVYAIIPELKELRAEVITGARLNGYVESLAGHRTYINGLNSAASKIREGAERSAFDALFQGTASGDIAKQATIVAQHMLDERWPDVLNPKVKLLLQVHDELLIEGPRDDLEAIAPLVTDAFKHAMTLDVPVISEYKIGKNWSEIH